MKGIKFILALAALLVVACQQEVVVVDDVANATFETSFAISEEQAIATLEETLNTIEGSTRSTGSREIVSVEKVKAADVVEQTRTTNVDLPEDMFYIVTFADGEGCAVLSADIRVTPVLAIFDETVLASEDFVNNNETRALSDINEKEDLHNFIVSQIENAAINQIVTSAVVLPPVEIVYTERVTEQTTIRYNPPMLDTKWDQISPFNYAHPEYPNNNNVPMGCAPVAIAQFLFYHRWPASGNLYGESFDWDLIAFSGYGVQIPIYNADYEASRFIYTIGNRIGAYAHGVNMSSLVDVLADFGISSNFRTFDVELASSIIENKGPFCMQAIHITAAKGHAWVVDGWLIQRTEVIDKTYNRFNILVEQSVVSSNTEYRMHCNFGWGGYCDGYYPYDVLCFNTTEELPEEFIETEYGDIGSANINEDYIYDSGFMMVAY